MIVVTKIKTLHKEKIGNASRSISDSTPPRVARPRTVRRSKPITTKHERKDKAFVGGEQRVLLRNVPWSAYVAILEADEERRTPRLAYQDGDLEVVVLSPEHEKRVALIELFLSLISQIWRVDCVNFGASTYKRDDAQRGSEPDSSWYFRNTAAMRQKERIDMASDPAPDLVVEVDITSPSLDKLPIYATLGVVEVWLYQSGILRILVLNDGNQIYTEQTSSQIFPQLTAKTASEFLAIAPTMPRYEWMSNVQDWATTNRQKEQSSL